MLTSMKAIPLINLAERSPKTCIALGPKLGVESVEVTCSWLKMDRRVIVHLNPRTNVLRFIS
jgi:hypothetical protein